jgi:hypothetical protein
VNIGPTVLESVEDVLEIVEVSEVVWAFGTDDEVLGP